MNGHTPTERLLDTAEARGIARAVLAENSWKAGNRAAWVVIIQEGLLRLGYHAEETKEVNRILERERALAVIRRLCASFGDNDWEENLALDDILEKHLASHLEAA